MNKFELDQLVQKESGGRKTWQNVQDMGIAKNITATLETKGKVDKETVYDFIVIDKSFDCLLG